MKPTSAKTASSQIPLPDSVEEAYRKKCIDLKKRLLECEDWNDQLVVRNERLRRGVQRLRLERALLLREIERRTEPRVDDSDGTPSPPPTPLRLKRPKRDVPSFNAQDRHGGGSPPGSPINSSFTPKFTSVNLAAQAEPVQSSPLASAAQAPAASSARKSGSRSTAASRSSASRQNAIQKPKNAYMIFCEQERASLVARETSNGEDEDNIDVSKLLAKAWQGLGPEGQEPYYLEFDAQRERYKQAMEDLNKSGGDSQKKRTKRSGGSTAGRDGGGGGGSGGGGSGGGAGNEGKSPVQEASDEEGSESEDSDHGAHNTDNDGKGSKAGTSAAGSGGFTAVNSSRPNFL